MQYLLVTEIILRGLEFPFVICLVRGQITDNIYSRNTIYMMLTRSFITSYFLINSNNDQFIDIYKEAANSISDNGVMCLREPSESEKKQQTKRLALLLPKISAHLRK